MEDVIPSIRFDHIFTDPPYLYIKTHDFDKEFDEALLFENARRILPDNGFIALFGRGTSFYRWNTSLAELGFVFKEEIVWDKRFGTSPAMAISRVHETVSLHTKKCGKIRNCKAPYIEQKKYDMDGIINDIKRIKSAINSDAGLNNILDFLKNGTVKHGNDFGGHGMTNASGLGSKDPAAGTLRFIKNGMREKTIMPVFPAHYGSVHPTEKPVRLAERIIALISDPGDTIYDPFMGSGSFGVACINTGRKYIGSEIDGGYFDIAEKRITTELKKTAQKA
ncbi:MAG: site-specific DNA-methyltransferase [Treponema sp.]|jgi:site-specific DNA-methyltransferase (adenine-specific)|nr:site-specific DNA-methyltransferase [Treponema sp.]